MNEANLIRAGRGRPKGAKNKVTRQAKQVLAALLDNNASKMQGALDTVAADNPADFLRIMLALAEFSVAKLQRTELAAEVKGDLPAIKVEFVNPKQNDS
jgi:hypothetical protein